MAEYVKKSDAIKIMEDNSHIMEVFGGRGVEFIFELGGVSDSVF